MKARSFLKRNLILLLTILLLTAVFAAGGSLAYYYWPTETVEGTRPGFSFDIDEFITDPGRNDGANPTSTRCYVRATIYKFWYYIDEENLENGAVNDRIQIIYYGHNNNVETTDDFNVVGTSAYKPEIIEIALDSNVGTGATSWTLLDDGFYYYNSILEVNQKLNGENTAGSVPEKLVKKIITESEKNNVGEDVHPGYYVVYEYLAADEQTVGTTDSEVSAPESAWKAKFDNGTWTQSGAGTP